MEYMWLLVFALVVILGLTGNLLGKSEREVKALKEVVRRFESFPQCFSLQDAVDKRLTEVATYWHQCSQKFVGKGAETAINQQLDVFNRLYSLVESTYGNEVKLRDKDIRDYLPEELKQKAS